jgi:hypothetical protein
MMLQWLNIQTRKTWNSHVNYKFRSVDIDICILDQAAPFGRPIQGR